MRRHIPSTRALLVFDAVARQHGVSRAAEELCLTHSAVSQQLRLLESQIGVRLVQRSARGTTLTEAGRRYHGQISGDLIRLQDHTLEAMARRTDGLRLIVGAVPVLAEGWLLPRLPGFTARSRAAACTCRSSRRCATWRTCPSTSACSTTTPCGRAPRRSR